jgi:acyl-coenzyme A thioesterase PaaI-like protein
MSTSNKSPLDGTTAGSREYAGRKQPNSRSCFVCGLENSYGLKLTFIEVAADEVISKTRVPVQFEGYPGIVHGGITAAMLDEVVSRAAMIGDHDHFRVTAKLELRYRKPVPSETELLLRGHLIQARGKLTRARGELVLPDGSIAAEAEALLADYDVGELNSARLEALGWRVYSDGETP